MDFPNLRKKFVLKPVSRRTNYYETNGLNRSPAPYLGDNNPGKNSGHGSHKKMQKALTNQNE